MNGMPYNHVVTVPGVAGTITRYPCACMNDDRDVGDPDMDTCWVVRHPRLTSPESLPTYAKAEQALRIYNMEQAWNLLEFLLVLAAHRRRWARLARAGALADAAVEVYLHAVTVGDVYGASFAEGLIAAARGSMMTSPARVHPPAFANGHELGCHAAAAAKE